MRNIQLGTYANPVADLINDTLLEAIKLPMWVVVSRGGKTSSIEVAPVHAQDALELARLVSPILEPYLVSNLNVKL